MAMVSRGALCGMSMPERYSISGAAVTLADCGNSCLGEFVFGEHHAANFATPIVWCGVNGCGGSTRVIWNVCVNVVTTELLCWTCVRQGGSSSFGFIVGGFKNKCGVNELMGLV